MRGAEHRTLLIAGLDPSAGAGLMRDALTCKDFNVESFTIMSANTIQHEEKFISLEWSDMNRMKEQIILLAEIHSWNTVKIGLIENAEVLNEMIELLKSINYQVKIIWDPIVKASAGFEFYQWNMNEVEVIAGKLFLITPNKSEFINIFGVENLEMAIKKISSKTNLLIKSFSENENTISDSLFTLNHQFNFMNQKLDATYSKHGTGCRLSSAVAACISNGLSLNDSVQHAIDYVHQYMLSSQEKTGNYSFEKYITP